MKDIPKHAPVIESLEDIVGVMEITQLFNISKQGVKLFIWRHKSELLARKLIVKRGRGWLMHKKNSRLLLGKLYTRSIGG